MCAGACHMFQVFCEEAGSDAGYFRQFVAATYSRFWARYAPRLGQRPHCYEVYLSIKTVDALRTVSSTRLSVIQSPAAPIGLSIGSDRFCIAEPITLKQDSYARLLGLATQVCVVKKASWAKSV